MMRSLKRRLDRLADQVGSAGRMITLHIAHEHVEDSTLIDATPRLPASSAMSEIWSCS